MQAERRGKTPLWFCRGAAYLHEAKHIKIVQAERRGKTPLWFCRGAAYLHEEELIKIVQAGQKPKKDRNEPLFSIK